MPYNVIVICGPTASGKTALSIDIAKRMGLSIVSADSMQIYREMNIGTAKPDMRERDGIDHYMIDTVSVSENYNVSRYVDEAGKCIDEILKRDRQVILTGGTGLYIDSLINNTDFFEIDNDLKYRERMTAFASAEGGRFLLDVLLSVDPETAVKLHENDTKRIIRALEVYRVTGTPISEIQRNSRRERKYNPLFIGLNYDDREILYRRIEKRVDLMIEAGLLDEASALMNKELSDTARAAIGYSDIFECLEGVKTLEQAVADIKKKTRNYAKRQLTWFRKNDEINWFYPDRYDCSTELFEDVYKFISDRSEVQI